METTVLNDKLAFSSKTNLIGAENGDYGHDVFLMCSRTIIKF
jgi:hypothetical protein